MASSSPYLPSRLYRTLAVMLSVALLSTSVSPQGWFLLLGPPSVYASDLAGSFPPGADGPADPTGALASAATAPFSGLGASGEEPVGLLADPQALDQALTARQAPVALVQPLSVSRVQSVYRVADAIGSTLVVTFTVTNHQKPTLRVPAPFSPTTPITDAAAISATLAAVQAFSFANDPNTIRDVALSDTLLGGVLVSAASPLPNQRQSELAWNLGDVPPLGTVTATVTLRLPTLSGSDFVTLDSGATAWGHTGGRMVKATGRAITLAPNQIEGQPIGEWLRWTVDADTRNPEMLALAAQSGQTPETLLATVQGLGYEAYAGSLRGTRGTIWSAAGNSVDKSSLLIAMLRASGIPARYRHGQLAPAEAQRLIGSMFPVPDRVIGRIPEGMPVSDPINDPALLALARDHWWVEAYLPGQGWRDLDPSFPDAAIGARMVAPGAIATDGSDRLAELPDAVRHKVSMRVKIENYHPLNVGAQHLDHHYPLSTTVNAVELVGVPVTLGHLVNTQFNSGAPFYVLSHSYRPYFTIGNRMVEGEPFQDMRSNFPFGNHFITGLWWQFELREPDGSVTRHEREIIDKVGFENRQSGGTLDLGAGGGTDALLSEGMVYQATFGPSAVPMSALQARFEPLRAATEAGIVFQSSLATVDQRDPAVRREALQHFRAWSTEALASIALSHYSKSDRTSDVTAAGMLVRAYPEKPRVIITGVEMGSAGVMTMTIDLLGDELATYPYPGQNREMGKAFLSARGVLESVIEGEVLEAATGRPAITTQTVFETALRTPGVEILFITPDTLDRLEAAPLSAEAKGRIVAAVRAGKFVSVPSQMVTIAGYTTVGWWEHDTETGNVSGVMESGLHQAMTMQLFLFNLAPFAAALVGYFQGWAVVTFQTLASLFEGFNEGDFNIKEIVRRSLINQLLGVAMNAWALAIKATNPAVKAVLVTLAQSIPGFIQAIGSGAYGEFFETMMAAMITNLITEFLGLFEYGIIGGPSRPIAQIFEFHSVGHIMGQINMIVFFAIVFVADPPVPPSLLSPPSGPPAPSTQRRRVVLAGATPPFNGSATLTAAHARVRGTLAATWQGRGAQGFGFETLTSTASVYDAQGALLGSGALSAQAGSRPATATSRTDGVAVALNGRGQMGLYAPATSGLGLGGQWERYTATLSAATPYTLTLEDATLTLGATTRTGTFRLVATGPTTLSGAGESAVPAFAPGASIATSIGALHVGPASVVSGTLPANPGNGLALRDFSGTLLVGESSPALDRLTLSGSGTPMTLRTTPASSQVPSGSETTFRAEASASGPYTLTVEAPEGWATALDATGLISATAPLGTPPGNYLLLVSAESAEAPGLFASTVHTVTTTPVDAVAVGLVRETLITVPWLPEERFPWHGMELRDSAFSVVITNTATLSHTYEVTVSGLPAGWGLLSGTAGNTITRTLGPGEVGQVGLYISPVTTPLPAAGTEVPFTVDVVALDRPTLAAQRQDRFVVPAIAYGLLTASPEIVYSTPGGSATLEVGLHNIGNVPTTFPLMTTLPDGWSASLAASVPLGANERATRSMTIQTPTGEPGQREPVMVRVSAGGYTRTAAVLVHLVSPELLELFQVVPEVATLFPNQPGLVATLANLSQRIENLETACLGATVLGDPDEAPCNTALRDRVASAIRAVGNAARPISPLLTVDETLPGLAAQVGAQTTVAGVRGTVAPIREAIGALRDQLAALANGGARAWFDPGLRVVRANQSATTDLRLTNTGRLTSTYAVTLTSTVPGSSPTVLARTLAPGGSVVIPMAVTPPTLGTFRVEAEIALQGAAGLPPLRVTGAVRAVEALLALTRVQVAPAFLEYGVGKPATVAAEVANLVNVPMGATARIALRNGAGSTVISQTQPVNLSSALVPVLVPLGQLSSSGLVTGTYTVTVSLHDASGALIPNASGQGTLAIGQAIEASQAVAPAIVAPGTVTVTSVITAGLNPTLLGLPTLPTAVQTPQRLATPATAADAETVALHHLTTTPRAAVAPVAPAVLPDPAQSTVSVTSPHPANSTAAATINGTLRNSGGTPLPGQSVWVVASGSGNTLSPLPVTTDAQGLFTVTLRSTVPEAKRLRLLASDGSGSLWLPGEPVVLFTGASLSGKVFSDANRDGVAQGGEAGLGGVPVRLFPEGSSLPLAERVTASDGTYSFSGLAAGRYRLTQAPLDAFAFSQGDTLTPTLAALGSVSGLDFGNYGTALLHGTTWNDSNQDGLRQSGEPVMPGVTVSHFDGNNQMGGTTTSDGEGAYRFELGAPLPVAPDNFVFNPGSALRGEPLASIANGTFARGSETLPAAVQIPNAAFESGGLGGWTASSGSFVQVVSDTSSLPGGGYHALLSRFGQTIESPAFVVPADAQAVRFDFLAWTDRNATEAVPATVSILTGPTFATATTLANLSGSAQAGWQGAVVNLQSYAGRTVKLRFGSDTWDARNGKLRLDRVRFTREVPDWQPSDPNWVRVVADTTSPLGGQVLEFGRHSGTATSSAFTVPAEAQSLRFYSLAWTDRNATEDVPVSVSVLSGPTFMTTTVVSSFAANLQDGWRERVIDLQAFAGQTVRLRFANDNHDSRNGKLRLADVTLGVEVPGWVPSSVNRVRVGARTSDESVSTTLANPNFSQGLERLPLSVGPANADFSQTPTLLNPANGPANPDFGGGALTPWSVSNINDVQVVDDAESIAGPHLRFGRHSQTATSAPFTVPAEAQSLRFSYFAWTDRNATEEVPLSVYALTGPAYTTSTLIATRTGSRNGGWQSAVVDLQAFAGQTIRLQIANDPWDSRNGKLRLDTIGLAVESPGWRTSDAAQVQVVTDIGQADGPALRFAHHSQTATSAPFAVPAGAQSLRFRFFAWTDRNALEAAPFAITALSGPTGESSTLLGSLTGTHNQGWQEGRIDLQAFAGQTIRLQIANDNYDSRNGKLLIDTLQLAVEVPGWSPSIATETSVTTVSAPADPGTSAPANADFGIGMQTLAVSPENGGFSQGRRLLDQTTYPANGDFGTGMLGGWSVSNSTFAGVVNDGQSVAGPYLRLNRSQVWALSPAFELPTDAQSLRFDYFAWTDRNPAEDVPMAVSVLSGPAFATETQLGQLVGAQEDGWQVGVLDLQAFAGQTIKLRFASDTSDSRNGKLRVDTVALASEVPGWRPSNAARVQVVNDAQSLNGNYLLLNGFGQWALSEPIALPAEVQSLRFSLSLWTDRNPAEDVPLTVSVLSGPDFATETTLRQFVGSQADGWQPGVVDLQAFAGQTVRLRLAGDPWDSRNGKARLDSLTLVTETPGWQSSDAARVQIESTNGISGSYLSLMESRQWAISQPFRVATNAENLRFRYFSWTDRSTGEAVPLEVALLSGPDFKTQTTLTTLTSSAVNGWQEATLSLAAFRGRTVKLRFDSDSYDVRNGKSRVDTIMVVSGAGGAQPGSEANPDGSYALLSRHSRSLTSSPFQVATDTQSVQFSYQAWTDRNATEAVPLSVYVMSGDEFATATQIGALTGEAREGWKTATLSLVAFRGQAIRLRFSNDTYDVRNGQLRLDAIRLLPVREAAPTVENTTGGSFASFTQWGGQLLSAPIAIPANAQSLQFDYRAWTNRNGAEAVPLTVQALSGPTFGTQTTLATLTGTAAEGWKRAALSLVSLRGQTIRLRFSNDTWDARNGLAEIDSVVVLPLSTIPATLRVVTPPNFSPSTPTEVATSLFAGADVAVDFGHFSVDRYRSTVTVAPTTLPADGTSSASVTITLRDSAGAPLAGRQVEIIAPGNAITITQPAGPTDAQGRATGTLRATRAQSTLVTARTLGDSVTLAQSVAVTFTAGLPDPLRSTFEASPAVVAANGSSSAALSVTLRDRFDNPVPGRPVTITTGSPSVVLALLGSQTNAQGQLLGTIRSSQPQTVTLQATDSAAGITLAARPVVRFSAVDPQRSTLVVAPPTVLANGSATASVTVTLRNEANQPLPGKTVTLSSSGPIRINGQPASGPVTIGQTDGAGQVVAQLSATSPGLRTLSATGETIPLAATAQVEFVVGPVDPTISSVSADRLSLPADGVAQATITAILRDSSGHPVADKQLRILASGAAVTVTQPIIRTDSQGRVQATIRATQPQTVTVSARNQSDSQTLAETVTLRFTPGPAAPARSTVLLAPTTRTADGVQSTTITATLRDAFDHPVTGRLVALSVSGSGNLIQPAASQMPDSSGRVVFRLASSRAETKTVTVRDLTYNVSLPAGQVTFLPGTVDAARSGIIATPAQAPADGTTPVTLIATLRDGQDNPVAGVPVTFTLGSSEGYTLTQPVAPTNSSGQASATLVGRVDGPQTVRAYAAGLRLDAVGHVTFVGTDLALEASASPTAIPGREVVYRFVLTNAGLLTAPSTRMTGTLPSGVTLLRQVSPFPMSVAGTTLAWEVGTLAPGAQAVVEVIGMVGAGVPVGTGLTMGAEATTSASERQRTNNSASATATTVVGYAFNVALTPATQVAAVGATATYRLQVANTGTLPDRFALTLTGLPATWYQLSATSLQLAAGEVGEVLLTVSTVSCSDAGTRPFGFGVRSEATNNSQPAAGSLTVVAAPLIEAAAPDDGAGIGATSALFTWQTAVTSTSALFLRPVGAPAFTTHAGDDAQQHAIAVNGLARNTTYEWYVRSVSACGSAESARRTFRVLNGIVFSQRDYTFNVERDYNQLVTVAVQNQDVVAHSLVVSVTNPFPELIVGFVGAGSSDLPITLQPGESRQVQLGVHTQDVTKREYTLTARLVADDGGAAPIQDAVPLTVKVKFPTFNVAITELSSDPLTLVRRYRVTNQGDTLSDVAITAELSGTGDLYLTPGMNHGYLSHGESFTFEAIPAADTNFSGLTGQIRVSGGGGTATQPVNITLPPGKSIFLGTARDVSLEANVADWYCTNRPIINNRISLPPGFRRADVVNARFLFNVRSAWEGVRPHDISIRLNGTEIGALDDVIPQGLYTFPVDPELLNEAAVGPSVNTFGLVTTHLNGGHYVVATEMTLALCLNAYREWVAAGSQAEADAIVQARSFLFQPPQTLGVEPLAPAAGQSVYRGIPTTIRVRVNDDVGRPWSYVVTAEADNGNGSLLLFDDGAHDDGAARDGIYGTRWTPSTLGPTTLTLRANSCTIGGQQQISVTVVPLAYTVNIEQTVPLTGTQLVAPAVPTATLQPLPGAMRLGWTTLLDGSRLRITPTLRLALPAMQPGEVREISQGTVISYTGSGGTGRIAMGPLRVAARHLIATTPPTHTTSVGGTVVYTLHLLNPGPGNGPLRLSVAGLPSGWVAAPTEVLLPPGGQTTRPLTVTVPADDDPTLLGDHPFSIIVETPTGQRDQAQAWLRVRAALDIALAPDFQGGRTGEVVTYTLVVTNSDTLARVYALQTEGLGANTIRMPASLPVPAGMSVSVPVTVTLNEAHGLYPFVVRANGAAANREAGTLLGVVGTRQVIAGLAPRTATGGRGVATHYSLTITNTGSLTDSYQIATTLPSGWQAQVRANNLPVSRLSLPPHLFNVSSLTLVVTPTATTAPGSYPFTVAIRSEVNPTVGATVGGTLVVSQDGVRVDIQPDELALSPTGTGRWQVALTNTGLREGSYRLRASGIISESARFTPSVIALAPGETRLVEMVAQPVRTVLPQRYPILVHAFGLTNPDIVGEDAARIRFTGFEAASSELSPPSRVVTGSAEASFMFVITNTGNLDTLYALTFAGLPNGAQLVAETTSLAIPAHMTAGVIVRASGLLPGTHTLTAQAVSASGSATTSASATITVQPAACSLRWDVVVNGIVDIHDVAAMGQAWNTAAPPRFDMTGDGLVRIEDVQIVAAHWGERCAP